MHYVETNFLGNPDMKYAPTASRRLNIKTRRKLIKFPEKFMIISVTRFFVPLLFIIYENRLGVKSVNAANCKSKI
jgi:hypothetical protein